MIVDEKYSKEKSIAKATEQKTRILYDNCKKETRSQTFISALVYFCFRHLICYHYEFVIPYLYNGDYTQLNKCKYTDQDGRLWLSGC